MITAPKCKVCGSTHWGTCYTPPARSEKKRIAVFDETPTITPEKAAIALEVAKGKRGRPATGFDKKAYDRETAKARRAAKKEAKPK